MIYVRHFKTFCKRHICPRLNVQANQGAGTVFPIWGAWRPPGGCWRRKAASTGARESGASPGTVPGRTIRWNVRLSNKSPLWGKPGDDEPPCCRHSVRRSTTSRIQTGPPPLTRGGAPPSESNQLRPSDSDTSNSRARAAPISQPSSTDHAARNRHIRARSNSANSVGRDCFALNRTGGETLHATGQLPVLVAIGEPLCAAKRKKKVRAWRRG
jgi:hypothetical protein